MKKEISYCIAFADLKCLAQGTPAEVLLQVKDKLDQGEPGAILIFDQDSCPIEWDFRGTREEVQQQLQQLEQRQTKNHHEETHANTPQKTQTGPGRPKLGVIAREVTLLPRHWEWLNQQQGGTSVALRKLVEEASKRQQPHDQLRNSQEITYRFMTAIAGNLPNYEEALRALYAGNAKDFAISIEQWPADLQHHISILATHALPKDTLS